MLAADGLAWSGGLTRYKKEEGGYQRRGREPATPVDNWVLKDGEITAGFLTEDFQPTPVFVGSDVAYERPMLEDGEFEFEMFVDEKQKKMCHVSIGRTALLLKSDGVWRHEMDKGRDVPEDEKIEGSKTVDLKDGDWNQVLLRLVGDKATLLVNDAEVATIDVVDAKALRFPGLFRFSDQSNAQVRGVKLRGNWPTSLPAVDQQELAQTSNDLMADTVTAKSKCSICHKASINLNRLGWKSKKPLRCNPLTAGSKLRLVSSEMQKNGPRLFYR